MSSSTISNIQYEQMMDLGMASVLISICICGLAGNAIVLGVGVIRKKYRNNVTNCYIMNLAITDFSFLLISVPFTAYLGVKKIWIYGEFLCKIHIYLAYVFLQATCLTLAAMSIDRYLNTVHEIWYRKYRKPKYAQAICLFIWIVSLVFMFPYEHLLDIYGNKNNQSSHNNDCRVNDEFSSCIFTFVFYYILPLSVIGVCYLGVFLYVRRTGYKIVKYLSGAPRQSIQLKRRRLNRMLLGLTLAFALCWLPIHILEIVNCSKLLSKSFYKEYYYSLNTIRMIAHALSYFNSCLNPFLYALFNRIFFH